MVTYKNLIHNCLHEIYIKIDFFVKILIEQGLHINHIKNVIVCYNDMLH